ncbi:hypothetical protein [Zunongwangia profunda]|jgi:hypothetical protein|uniref:hypothetical protein n=1 Tax=Zunongwangia profunda TaxID=398743 RepID=UPI001D186D67|nr:hypothetical protein [Zunongwangia profunda]MCC4230063.1 hypothetical protein [Zunongwangia profunda]|tara:strand:- start:8217 stop:8441 length:225 start_codon:yes stop_codon:yes gene_type:complete
MKKKQEKLFAKFEIKKSLDSIIGGSYTSSGSDTSAAGGHYDHLYETSDNEGNVTTDSADTGSGTKDKPLQDDLN